MIKYENYCCDCSAPGYPCVGSLCPNINVPVYYCDACENETPAKYLIDNEHYCEVHAKQYMQDCFDCLTLAEKAEILDVSFKNLEK